jgi:hypothetical protein
MVAQFGTRVVLFLVHVPLLDDEIMAFLARNT